MLKFLTIVLLFILFKSAVAQNTIPAEPVSSPQLTRDFICSEVIYPETGLENKDEGTVALTFTVATDGNVSNIEISQSVAPAIDAEALRVFRMILWKPAERLGQPIESRSEFEIDFNIKKYKKHCKKRGYDRREMPFSPVDTSLRIYDLSGLEKAPVPVFKSGFMNLEKFMQENLEYPELAYRQNISGKVSLDFIVEAHGRVSNITISKSLGGGCNEEAIRLLRMLSWMPGIKNLTAVRSRMHLEITFSLPSDTQHQLFDYNQNTSF